MQRLPSFGGFINPESPFYEEFHPKFLRRLAQLNSLALDFLETVKRSNPVLARDIHYSQFSLAIAVARYFNDAIRLRSMHDIKLVHEAKIAAYTLKWIWLNPPFTFVTRDEQLLTLSESDKALGADINYRFVAVLLDFFLAADDEARAKIDSFVEKVCYAMKTGVYEEHMAAILFETVRPVIEPA